MNDAQDVGRRVLRLVQVAATCAQYGLGELEDSDDACRCAERFHALFYRLFPLTRRCLPSFPSFFSSYSSLKVGEIGWLLIFSLDLLRSSFLYPTCYDYGSPSQDNQQLMSSRPSTFVNSKEKEKVLRRGVLGLLSLGYWIVVCNIGVKM